MQEVFQQQEMTDAKNVTGAQQGEKETDTVSKIETTQNSENEVVSDEKAGSSEISEESNSESAVQDTEANHGKNTANLGEYRRILYRKKRRYISWNFKENVSVI